MSTNSIVSDPGFAGANVSPAEVKPRRYHPVLVALHWLIAVLIFVTVLLAQENEGGDRFRPGERNLPPQGSQQGTPKNSQPGNPPPGFSQGSQSIFSTIGIHMIVGVTILVLLIIRLLVRWRTQPPDWASTGNKFLDWVGNMTHVGLYSLTFVLTITGIVLANQRGILARTFGIGSTPAPGTYLRGGFRLGMLHGAGWTLLLLLILLHIGAALYHQFILKDNLLGRMWFGKSEE